MIILRLFLDREFHDGRVLYHMRDLELSVLRISKRFRFIHRALCNRCNVQ